MAATHANPSRTRDFLAPADVDRTLRRVHDFVARVADAG